MAGGGGATREAVIVDSVVVIIGVFTYRESAVIRNSRPVSKSGGVEETAKGALSHSHLTHLKPTIYTCPEKERHLVRVPPISVSSRERVPGRLVQRVVWLCCRLAPLSL